MLTKLQGQSQGIESKSQNENWIQKKEEFVERW